MEALQHQGAELWTSQGRQTLRRTATTAPDEQQASFVTSSAKRHHEASARSVTAPHVPFAAERKYCPRALPPRYSRRSRNCRQHSRQPPCVQVTCACVSTHQHVTRWARVQRFDLLFSDQSAVIGVGLMTLPARCDVTAVHERKLIRRKKRCTRTSCWGSAAERLQAKFLFVCFSWVGMWVCG